MVYFTALFALFYSWTIVTGMRMNQMEVIKTALSYHLMKGVNGWIANVLGVIPTYAKNEKVGDAQVFRKQPCASWP